MKQVDIYTSNYYKYYHGFIDFLKGVNSVALKAGFTINVIDNSVEDVAFYTKKLQNDNIRVVLVIGVNAYLEIEIVREFTKNKIPFILIHKFYPSSLSINTISINYKEAAFDITNHLINCNRKKIAFLVMNVASSVDFKKLEGYKNALLTSSIPFDESNIFYYGEGSLSEAIQSFSKKIDLFDSVVCSTDSIALALIKSENLKHISIPNDLAIVGFDNLKLGTLIKPYLTTVSPNFHEIGANSIQSAILLTNNPGIKNLHLICEHKLIIRESCGSILHDILPSNIVLKPDTNYEIYDDINLLNNSIPKEGYFDKLIYSIERIENFFYTIKPIEKQIILMLYEGFVYKEIAAKLYLSEASVKYYLQKIEDKLSVRNRKELTTLLFKYIDEHIFKEV